MRKKINFGKNKKPYPINFVDGWGTYYIAINHNTIVASMLLPWDLDPLDSKHWYFFSTRLQKKFPQGGIITYQINLRFFCSSPELPNQII